MKPLAPSDRELLAEAFELEARAEARAEHLEPQELLDYQLGELDPATEESVRDHLVSCRECSAQLLELEALTPEPPPAEDVADLEMVSSWRELQGRLEPPAESPSESPAEPPAGTRWRLQPSWVAAAAAVLLLLPAGLVMDAIRLRGELDGLKAQLSELAAPHANPAILLVDPRLRSAEQTVQMLPEDPFVNLVFTLTDRRFKGYELRFASASGEPLSRLSGLVDDKGSVSVRLYREALPSEEFIAELIGLGEDSPEVLQVVRLRNAAAAP